MRTRGIQSKPKLLGGHMLQACRTILGAGTVALSLAGMAASTTPAAQAAEHDSMPLKDRHIGVQREAATKYPRSEADQALVDGWPMYRTERGQTAFNDAMATLKTTEGAAPSAHAFKGCAGLECNLTLPALRADGWLPPGRLWVSSNDYVLIAHSPRLAEGKSYRRRGSKGMKYFVFHEFHNSSRNTDLYDTVSSHKSSVFVPLYMSKTATDANGRRFVIVLQVAPHDVVSIHATNRGSAGPGIEVAKNASEATEPLQNLAGLVVATIVKAAVPRLQVVNHNGTEGLPMLNAYEGRLESLKARPGASSVTLPFVPAAAQRLATATGKLADLISRGDASPRTPIPIPIAERAVVPPRAAMAVASPAAYAPEPKLIGPIRLATRRVPVAVDSERK